MPHSNKERILLIASVAYTGSSDFNGLAASVIAKEFNISWPKLKKLLIDLVNEDMIEVLSSDLDVNPHIRRTSFISTEAQISDIQKSKVPDRHIIYPKTKYLSSYIEDKDFENEPYRLELAKGAAQLDYRAFDLSVLEYYRNDPRYHYDSDDLHGWISIKSEFFETGKMQEADQILLESFGFCYDDEGFRYVAVYLRYLRGLTPEHQKIWKAKQINKKVKLNADYFRTSIVGDFAEGVSIFEASLYEIELINEMCKKIGMKNLFLNSYKDPRPKKFGFLLRPTTEELNAFILLLDKILSDNINRKFFDGQLDLENEVTRNDGRIEVRQKGTIQLWAEWINKYFVTDDTEQIDSMLRTFRLIREMRQKPAHAIKEDMFDQDVFRQQRELMHKTYNALKTIRMIFTNHPKVRGKPIEIWEAIEHGRIWDR